MKKNFEVECDGEVFEDELRVYYIVLFGAYNNEHPEDHFEAERSRGRAYETAEEAKERAEGFCNAKIWEIALCDDGMVAFATEIK